MKHVFRILAGLVNLIGGGVFFWPAPPTVSHPYFETVPKGEVEIIAHGGGLGHAPPNTFFALERAVQMGADVLEADVQQTQDGILILRHDDTLDRTTNMTGLIADYDWADLEQADAGARTKIDRMSFAGLGIKIPRLDQALAQFPDARWILEIKNDTDAAAIAMCQTLQDADAGARVLVGSFHDQAMRTFRGACPNVATSMSSGEVRNFVLAARIGASRLVQTKAVAMQIPVSAAGLDLSHARVLNAAHARGFRVQYWTINEALEMDQLIEAGADGLITDYVDAGRHRLEMHRASDLLQRGPAP